MRYSALVDGGGQSHGAVRWKQHYCLDEVLREISILRKVLIEELLRFHCDTKVELKLPFWRGRTVAPNLEKNGLD